MLSKQNKNSALFRVSSIKNSPVVGSGRDREQRLSPEQAAREFGMRSRDFTRCPGRRPAPGRAGGLGTIMPGGLQGWSLYPPSCPHHKALFTSFIALIAILFIYLLTVFLFISHLVRTVSQILESQDCPGSSS